MSGFKQDLLHHCFQSTAHIANKHTARIYCTGSLCGVGMCHSYVRAVHCTVCSKASWSLSKSLCQEGDM